MDARLLQYELEVQADANAATARLAELRKAAADGDTDVPRASRLIARMYAEVERVLQEQADSRAVGVGAKYKSWLRALPTDVAAVIAVRTCIKLCADTHRPVVVQEIAQKIGSLWETEVRIREAEAVNPMYMQRIHDQVRENSTRSESHLRRLYRVAYERVMKGAADDALNQTAHIHIGKFGLHACYEAGLVEQVRGVGKNGWLVHYVLSAEIQEFLSGYSEQDVALVTDKMSTGMVCPPDDWTNTTDGGYVTLRRKTAYPLLSIHRMRRSERARLHSEFTAEKMPKVFECANYLQSLAFSIHKPTLEAIRKVWVDGGGALGVPYKNPPVRPVLPFASDWKSAEATPEELEKFTAWKFSVRNYYDNMREWRGKVREIGAALRTMEKYDGPVWFPAYVDSRGRWYYRGTPNPQGSDLAKAVLHWHEKKALGHSGEFWLKVHIANSFGFDKARFIDRARWTEQNWARIEVALDHPEDHPDVFGTDAPWCMFSAAWELREAYRSGNPSTYQTGAIVHMDATCSGLQHFAAALRDPVGGMYVNLVDEGGEGPKQDIYTRVAHYALEAIKRDLEGEDMDVRARAAWWVSAGLHRALAKKPVMTYVYGATLRGTAQHIASTACDSITCEWPVGVDGVHLSNYAGKKLFQGIAAAVPAAESAMRWLREIAQQYPAGKRMQWKSPTGFLVQHDYQATDEVRVRIRSCGVQYITVREYTDRTSPLQMQNAIAPNFVHALDAAHLNFTALRMKAAGLHMVGIHDSYGTHPCDVPEMHKHLREAFVELYEGRNVFVEFLWDIGVTAEAPMRGTLDVRNVLNSEFFFC